jgi:hypothetical protein
MRKISKRIIFLSVIWIVLLLTIFSFLTVLVGIFNSNPEGRTIVSISWAGYTISKGYNTKVGVTNIEATWTVPQVNASKSDGFSSAWIGVGGQTDKTLIQVGTEHDLIKGQETYRAWYEMLPNFAVTINEIRITPGDTIVASLTLIDSKINLWNIKLSDLTNGQSFKLSVNYNSTLSSGEWIVERPSINNQISTMCDFGTATFSNCQLDLNYIQGTIANFSYSKIQMTNQLNEPLASVSTLSSDGSGFNVNYVSGK